MSKNSYIFYFYIKPKIPPTFDPEKKFFLEQRKFFNICICLVLIYVPTYMDD